MWEIIRRNPQTMIIAVLLHALIVGLMIVGLDWIKQPEQKIQRVDVVQARLVDSEKLQQSQQKKQQEAAAVAAKQEQERQQAEREKQQAVEERKRVQQAEVKKKEEAKKQAELKKKTELEKQRQIALKKKKEEEKRKKAEQEKKRQAELERKRKLEQEKKAAAEKKKKAEEAKRKEEARKQAAAKERAAREAREAQMTAQLQAEQAASEGSRIAALIQHKVQSNWTFFPGAKERGLRCKVKVRVNSNGSVLRVNIVESSGDAAFDRSVETAVYKTDPFPMPESAALRALPQFREHEFYFNPSK